MVLTGTDGYPYAGDTIESASVANAVTEEVNHIVSNDASNDLSNPFVPVIGFIGAMFLFLRFRGKL